MKIQWVSIDDEFECKKGIQYSNFTSPLSLDTFDLNIFDLRDEDFWKTKSNVKDFLDLDEDLTSIKTMIVNSSKTKHLFLLPRNIEMHHGYSSTKLKSMIHEFKNHIQKIVDIPFKTIEFERTTTNIKENEIDADFYFLNGEEIHTKSLDSEKATTVSNINKSVYFTSLNITQLNDIYIFLKEINLYKNDKEYEPYWMEEVQVLDDSLQLENIQLAEKKIAEEKRIITQSEEKLEQNKRFKSILYTNSDQLVEVVFEMIEEMLEVDLSEFVDHKKEDITFKIDDEFFIGEIKGISDNVKASRLAQLDNHLYYFLDNNEDVEEANVRRLLIINHQRKKPIDDRDSIDNSQIDLAVNKYGSLIIETSELLKLFEMYKNKLVTREQIITLFRRTGKLKVCDEYYDS